jgi:hypothetical protein
MEQHNKFVVEGSGWIGMVLIIGAYIAVSFGWLGGTTLEFQVVNLVGGLAIAVNTYYHKAYPSLAVNIIWSIIAVIACIKIVLT